jgi:hypothetical protein
MSTRRRQWVAAVVALGLAWALWHRVRALRATAQQHPPAL